MIHPVSSIVKANLCGQLLLLLFFFFLKKINLIRNGVSDEVFTLLAEWKQTKNDVRHGQNDFFKKWGDADEAQGAVLQK
jgi:hypothetical protein